MNERKGQSHRMESLSSFAELGDCSGKNENANYALATSLDLYGDFGSSDSLGTPFD
jgi:hypothetical protein